MNNLLLSLPLPFIRWELWQTLNHLDELSPFTWGPPSRTTLINKEVQCIWTVLWFGQGWPLQSASSLFTLKCLQSSSQMSVYVDPCLHWTRYIVDIFFFMHACWISQTWLCPHSFAHVHTRKCKIQLLWWSPFTLWWFLFKFLLCMGLLTHLSNYKVQK